MRSVLWILYIGVICILFYSCQKELSVDNGPTTLLPTITTTAVTSIATTTSTSGGDISSDGGATVTARGVCWNTTANPVATDSHTTDGTGIGTFISNITSLNSGTIYHVRAYATNSAGTAYGDDVTFNTLTTPGITIPTLTTTAITSITSTSSASGGNISADGGATVTARGVCWGTSPAPVVTGNHTTDGTGIGAFASSITGLTASTVYYVRAYATNVAGTAYGNELSFTTSAAVATLPTLTTTTVTSITTSTALSGGNITSDGGATVTVRGVCWGIASNPVATGNHTTDGTGIGIFVSSVTGLTASTTYFVRAYATNSVGTAYGNELSFTTSATSGPDIYVAGDETAGATLYSVAKIWKNGVPTSLTSNPYNATANSVFVSGTDVYVAGNEHTTTSVNPTLWKNGVATVLSNPFMLGDARSVFVLGTDVYACGISYYDGTNWHAAVWKNGVLTTLPGGIPDADANSIYVVGPDVYVVGNMRTPVVSINNAVIWKNGVATLLTAGTANSDASSVFVSGTDVYVAGFENNGTTPVAKVWKNGVATSLTTGANEAGAYSVFVSGTDVYVAGYENNGTKLVAKIWKNGVATSLTNGAFDAVAYSVYIFGSDVYVSGFEDNGTAYVAKIWKNGVATSLTNGAFDAGGYSIFVK